MISLWPYAGYEYPTIFDESSHAPTSSSLPQPCPLDPAPAMETAADSFNNSNASSPAGGYSTYKQGPVVTLVFIVGYTLCFVLCVVGNSFVCAIVAKYHNLHTVTNFFIFNLAAADLLVALFCMPVTLISNIVTEPFSVPLGSLPALINTPSTYLSPSHFTTTASFPGLQNYGTLFQTAAFRPITIHKASKQRSTAIS
ncbi:Neuropeptide FF receptor 2 [Branchiostoma belcheri]|nr:Neuropeptide FF receptor 2 [Branchiostoma belcheri]